MNGIYWLVAYPKSGHTWLRLSLWSLLHGKPPDFNRTVNTAPMAAAYFFFEDALHVDASDLTLDEIERLRPRQYEQEVAACREPLLRKVHDAWTRTSTGEPIFPAAITLGTIYVVRDPRDVAVSLTHHLGMTQDAVIDFLGNPEARLSRAGHAQARQRLLDWSGHVEGWLGAPGPSPLVIRYEDRLADPQGTLAQVADHLGWNFTAEQVTAAAEVTHFDALQATEDQVGFQERSIHGERFFRRGMAGGWRDTLTVAQAARIERDHGRVMARMGYL